MCVYTLQQNLVSKEFQSKLFGRFWVSPSRPGLSRSLHKVSSIAHVPRHRVRGYTGVFAERQVGNPVTSTNMSNLWKSPWLIHSESTCWTPICYWSINDKQICKIWRYQDSRCGDAVQCRLFLCHIIRSFNQVPRANCLPVVLSCNTCCSRTTFCCELVLRVHWKTLEWHRAWVWRSFAMIRSWWVGLVICDLRPFNIHVVFSGVLYLGFST